MRNNVKCLYKLIGIFVFAIMSCNLMIVKADERTVSYSGEKEGFTWTIYDDGELEIEGTTSLPEIGKGFDKYSDSVKKIVVKDGITGIGRTCFMNFHSLETVIIADSVKIIDDGAFYNCKSISDITMPASIKKIAEDAFANAFISEDDGDVIIRIPETIQNEDTVKMIYQATYTYGSISYYVKTDSVAYQYFSSLYPFDGYKVKCVETIDGDPVGDLGEKKEETSTSEEDDDEDVIENPPKESEETEGEKGSNEDPQKGTEDPQKTTEDTQNEVAPVKYKIGKTYKKGRYKYTITGKKTAAYAGAVKKNVKVIEIPSKVKFGNKYYKITQVKKRACKGYKKLRRVILNDYITKIGDEAFMNCTSLKSVLFGKNLKKIGKKALYGDAKLSYMNMASCSKLSYVGKNSIPKVKNKINLSLPEKRRQTILALLGTGVVK